jgi:hypothetical protein
LASDPGKHFVLVTVVPPNPIMLTGGPPSNVGHLGVIFDQRTVDAMLDWADAHTKELA